MAATTDERATAQRGMLLMARNEDGSRGRWLSQAKAAVISRQKAGRVHLLSLMLDGPFWAGKDPALRNPDGRPLTFYLGQAFAEATSNVTDFTS